MDLKKFWDCIKKSYRKLSFYELITMVFFAFVISGIIVGDVLAADNVTMKYQVPIVGGQNPQTLPLYINVVYKWLMGAGLVLVGIMVTIGGFMYVSSGGDAKTIGTGKKYIINALIGMLLLSSAYLILNTINPDATEMEDIVVKQVEGETLKSTVQVPWGCECHVNTDCINSVTSAYFCDWSGGGKLVYDAYVKSPITATLDEYVEAIIIAVGVTALVFGTAGLGAVPVLAKVGTTLVRGALTVAKFGTKVAWGAIKFTAKWILPSAVSLVVSNPALAVMAAFYFIGGGAAFDFELTTFEKTCNKPSGEVKGICLPNVFRYARLRPHAWGETDLVKSGKNPYEIGIFSIYNTDGTIPQRKSYFGDQQPFTIIADNSQQMVSVSHNFKDFITDGIANTDGCQSYIDKYYENYCPCLEWFGDNSVFLQCKRQAKCATLEATGKVAGGQADGRQICLTG
ncbi:MAG TPA: pilin, partial [bacterium]|nr:pilin [bacterium]